MRLAWLRTAAAGLTCWIFFPPALADSNTFKCAAILGRYEAFTKEKRFLPKLFVNAPKIAYDATELQDFEIDNVVGSTGDFNCKADGTLDSVQITAPLDRAESDVRRTLSATRFAAVATALLSAIKGNWATGDKIFQKLMNQSTSRSRESLIRGDKHPEGTSSVDLSGDATATLGIDPGGVTLTLDRSMAKSTK